ncbi:MAG: DUF350 domain-containing protein [Defluviicoccus sp.]|nr:DUF350 domain-containing protein [Defluviicoccus sp.]
MVSADLSGQTLAMLALGLAIVFAVLLSVRMLYGAAAGLDTTSELADKDNFAFGIGLAGMTLGVAIMLGGVAEGDFAASVEEEASALVVYAVLGLALMWLTRLIFDRVSIPAFSVKAEIRNGNVPIAIVEAGNVLATAVMVRAVIQWSEGSLAAALVAVVAGYVVTQVILTGTTWYRVWLFARRNAGKRFQDVVQDGNTALALRFAGFQMGVALAVTAAAQLVEYDPGGDPIVQALIWGACSVILAAILIVLSLLAERFVLRRIDVSEEVDRQRNIGVALTEVAVYAGIGLLFNGLLA